MSRRSEQVTRTELQWIQGAGLVSVPVLAPTLNRRPDSAEARAQYLLGSCANRKRRHSALGYLSPEEFERTAAKGASRPATTTMHHDHTIIGLGPDRIDDLAVHSGLQELSAPSVLGADSTTTGDRSPHDW